MKKTPRFFIGAALTSDGSILAVGRILPVGAAGGLLLAISLGLLIALAVLAIITLAVLLAIALLAIGLGLLIALGIIILILLGLLLIGLLGLISGTVAQPFQEGRHANALQEGALVFRIAEGQHSGEQIA